MLSSYEGPAHSTCGSQSLPFPGMSRTAHGSRGHAGVEGPQSVVPMPTPKSPAPYQSVTAERLKK